MIYSDDRIFKVKDITGTHIRHYGYAIFRVGKKFKTLKELKGFEVHMERKQETLNADPNLTKYNRILVGSSNILDDVKKYLTDVNIHSNNVIARELLLTASPQFFKNILSSEKERWIQNNINWLHEHFGDNLIYCSLHEDESTTHLNALIVPKFLDSKKQKYILSNRNYFNGRAKLSFWQDDYSKTMSPMGLSRGIKFSKSKHVQIRTFYSLINKDLDIKDLKQICAKAKNSQLLETKVIDLQNTLFLYKGLNKKSEKERNELTSHISQLRKDKKLLSQSIKTMSLIYKIPENTITQILKYTDLELKSSKTKESNYELDK